MRSPSRRLSALCLSLLLCAAPAMAAPPPPEPPSEAQIDRLMQALDYEQMQSQMMAQMAGASQEMAKAIAGDKLSAQQQKQLQQSMQLSLAKAEKMLAWEHVAPIYHKVYREVFTAEEVQAMTEFYRSPVGRSIRDKLPRAMGVTMKEMQPLMNKMLAELRAELERDAQRLQKRK